MEGRSLGCTSIRGFLGLVVCCGAEVMTMVVVVVVEGSWSGEREELRMAADIAREKGKELRRG